MTASSSGWMPLFLKAEPQQHRRDRDVERRRAQRAREHLRRDRLPRPRGSVSISSSSWSATASISWWWYSFACSASSAGISPTSMLGAEVVGPDDRLHLDEVDDAAEVLLLADRQLHRHRVRAEPVDHRLHRGEEVGADAVHLVDERDPRHAGTCRPAARPSRTAARRRRPRRRRRSRRRARAGCAPPRP